MGIYTLISKLKVEVETLALKHCYWNKKAVTGVKRKQKPIYYTLPQFMTVTLKA